MDPEGQSATGWSFAALLPQNTTRSLPIQSRYEQVDAETPSTRFIAAVEGLWQRRAALSTWGEP